MSSLACLIIVANTYVDNGIPVYFFHFDFVAPPMHERQPYGAGHGSDISYVFNTLHARWGNPKVTEDDQRIADTMNRYWVNFAKSGNPNGDDLPTWPKYDRTAQQILDIQRDGQLVGKVDPRSKRLDLIEKAHKMVKTSVQTRGI